MIHEQYFQSSKTISFSSTGPYVQSFLFLCIFQYFLQCRNILKQSIENYRLFRIFKLYNLRSRIKLIPKPPIVLEKELIVFSEIQLVSVNKKGKLVKIPDILELRTKLKLNHPYNKDVDVFIDDNVTHLIEPNNDNFNVFLTGWGITMEEHKKIAIMENIPILETINKVSF